VDQLLVSAPWNRQTDRQRQEKGRETERHQEGEGRNMAAA